MRQRLAGRLTALTCAPVDPQHELIITPGTQGALYLSLASLVEQGDRVGIIEPDYFANRRILGFLGAQAVPIRLDLFGRPSRPVLDVKKLRATLRAADAHVLCLSNPNNPTGAVLPRTTLAGLAEMCVEDDVFVVMDQLYCRQVFTGAPFTHLRALPDMLTRCVTLIGPSKTESLSGYRIGTAVGPGWLIDRMEAVLSITSLRAPGYSQRVLDIWLAEEPGWLIDRVHAHRAIRDRIMEVLGKLEGCRVRTPEAGSYLFVRLPELKIPTEDFIRELADNQAVVVTPGSEFGAGFDDFIRINFSQDADAAVAAVDRLVRLASLRRANDTGNGPTQNHLTSRDAAGSRSIARLFSGPSGTTGSQMTSCSANSTSALNYLAGHSGNGSSHTPARSPPRPHRTRRTPASKPASPTCQGRTSR